MKRKTIFLLILVALVPFSVIFLGNVNAYNYETPVEVGDILIYKYSSTSSAYDGVTHLQVNVTEISDGSGITLIRGIMTGSKDGGNTFDHLETLADLATLQDYSLDPVDLIDDMHFFVVPGTTVGIFAEDIEPLLSAGTATSIKNGFGIKIENCPDINKTLEFNEEGILTRYYNQDVNIYEATLFSINGERYFIPGYPFVFVVGFMLLGIIGVYISRFRKKTNN